VNKNRIIDGNLGRAEGDFQVVNLAHSAKFTFCKKYSLPDYLILTRDCLHTLVINKRICRIKVEKKPEDYSGPQVYSYLLKTNDALCPPNPNEFDKTAFTCFVFALFAT
jgi:hypothetical protein